MASTEEERVLSREEETKLYLENNRIIELFNNLTAQLIYQRPDDPKKFMVDVLEKLRKSRATHFDYPCMFDDANIQSIFGMLDPTNQGYISIPQYREAMTTLGVKEYDEDPTNGESERITFDIFLRVARTGLSKASATFCDKE